MDTEERYKEIEQYIDSRIQDIEKMKFYEHKIACLFLMVDTFSQNYINYQTKDFCKFILNYADKKKYYFLNDYDPVTLLYDLKNYPQSQVDIPQLEEPNIYTVDSPELKEILDDIQISKLPDRIKNKHKYIKLLYKCRSKLLHEGNLIGGIQTVEENNYEYLLYFKVSDYWKLIFPYKFLKELFMNCINNYLEECKKDKKDPFENNDMEKRKAFYGFWD